MPSSTTPVGGSPRSQAYVDIGSGEHGVRTERQERSGVAAQPEGAQAQNQPRGEFKDTDRSRLERDSKELTKAERDIFAEGMQQTREKTELMTQDMKKLVAHLSRRNQTSSPGKQKIMVKSIQSAYPMAGAAAFAAFGVMLLAAGPFGALTGIAIAYGAYSIYSALKQHQEAQMAMQNQQGGEGEAAGGHDPGSSGQSTNSLRSAAPGSTTEPKSGIGPLTSAARQKQEVKSEQGDAFDDDLNKDENVDDENAEPARAEARSPVAATTHSSGRTQANNLNTSVSDETATTMPPDEAQHSSAPPHTNAHPATASAAPSTTPANTSPDRTNDPTTHAGTSTASAAVPTTHDPTAPAPANGAASATTHANPSNAQRPSQT